MDPEQTLTEAQEAADNGLVADAQYLLDAYADWVSLGGFPADDAERRVRRVRQKLGRQAKAFRGRRDAQCEE